MASWLDKAFYSFDRGIFLFADVLRDGVGGVLTPLFRFITFLGNGGWAFILLGVILLLFKNTRKGGISLLIAILIGALITNVTLKNLVARARPYVMNSEYENFWLEAGGLIESEFSFPSGHSTVAMSSMIALFLSCRNKWRWTFIAFAFLLGFTRIYFIVHYATDVIAGLTVGALSGTGGYYLAKLIYNSLEKHKDKKFCAFLLEKDITQLFKKKENK